MKKYTVIFAAMSALTLSACREESDKPLTWELTERTIFKDGVEKIERDYLPTLDECRSEIEKRERLDVEILLALVDNEGAEAQTLYTFLDRRCMPVAKP